MIWKWHILANSGLINLKYVIILGNILTDVTPNQNIGGDVPGIPGGIDASVLMYSMFSFRFDLH